MSVQLETINLEQLKAVLLGAEDIKLAASVLYQSYQDDPLFMEIFQASKADYEQRLRAAIREELSVFWQAEQPVLGVYYNEQLLGVACVIGPDSCIGATRLWHWRLKMLLTAGYVSTKQLLEKEQRIHAAMPAEHSHTLAFIAVLPKYHALGLGHYLLHAINTLVDQDVVSGGIGVFVTRQQHKAFFAANHYVPVTELAFNSVKGCLMFRARQQQAE